MLIIGNYCHELTRKIQLKPGSYGINNDPQQEQTVFIGAGEGIRTPERLRE